MRRSSSRDDQDGAVRNLRLSRQRPGERLRRLAKSPDFEFYGDGFDPGTKTGEIEFHVPILR